MAGGERKGLFSRLFGRKDKSEESKPDKRQTKARLTKSVKAAQGAAEPALPEAVEGTVPVKARKSDAVELELDIPEHEISTVALSVEDLDVSLLQREESATPPLEAQKPAFTDETLPNGTEVEHIDGATESKADVSRLGAPEATMPVSSEIVAEPMTDEKRGTDLDEREAALKDVYADLTSRDDDELDIELDMEDEEDELHAEAPEERVMESPKADRSEPIPMTEQAAAEVTSGEVAMRYGRSEAEDTAAEEKEVETADAPAVSDTNQASPPVGPSGLADVPLAGELLCKLTPHMSAHAAALAQIVEACQTPMRIAVRGEPGSGKTSLINAIESHLTDSVLSMSLSARNYAGLGSFGPVGWQFLEDFIAGIEKKVSAANDERFAELAEEMRRCLPFAAQADVRSAAADLHPPESEHPDVRLVTEAVSKLRRGLGSMASQALDLASAQRLCVFLDDVDRLNVVTAVELIEAVNRFVISDNSVLVAVCDPDALARESQVTCPNAAGAVGGVPYLERTFQLSVNVPVCYSTELRLKELLDMAGWECSEEELRDYVELQRCSIGANPRREKLIVNKLMLMGKLRPDVCFGSEEDVGQTVLRQKLLFGLACLELTFPNVLDLMLSVLPSRKDLSLMLGEQLRTRDGVLALDRAFGLFLEGSDRDGLSSRLVGFMDAFVGLLCGDDRSEKLDSESAGLLTELLELAATTGRSTPEPMPGDARWSALTQFCRRVADYVRQMLGEKAPNVSDKQIRSQSSNDAWFSLWYAPDGVKDAWGFGRASYELKFDTDDVVSVSLRCDTARLAELGVPRERIDDLKSLPLLEDPQFRFNDYGAGLVEIVTVLHQCSFDSELDLIEDEVESVAESLQDLILATQDLFDLPQVKPSASVLQSAQQIEVQCKFCKAPLEQVLLKDGAVGYRCITCGRIYRPKAPLKPA